MAQYIDKDVLLAEIKKKKIPFKKDIDDGVYPTYLCALMDFEDFINTLEVKEINSTDAFIEKAYEFFDEHLWEYINVKANCDTFINIDVDKFKDDFKNYIKKDK